MVSYTPRVKDLLRSHGVALSGLAGEIMKSGSAQLRNGVSP